jgi:hypothetical protein
VVHTAESPELLKDLSVLERWVGVRLQEEKVRLAGMG